MAKFKLIQPDNITMEHIKKFDNDPIAKKLVKTKATLIVKLINALIQKELVKRYNITKYDYGVYTQLNAFGYVRARSNYIAYSIPLLTLRPLKQVINTITHEIAHVIVREVYFHNKNYDVYDDNIVHGALWKRAHQNIGGTGIKTKPVSNAYIVKAGVLQKVLTSIIEKDNNNNA